MIINGFSRGKKTPCDYATVPEKNVGGEKLPPCEHEPCPELIPGGCKDSGRYPGDYRKRPHCGSYSSTTRTQVCPFKNLWSRLHYRNYSSTTRTQVCPFKNFWSRLHYRNYSCATRTQVCPFTNLGYRRHYGNYSCAPFEKDKFGSGWRLGETWLKQHVQELEQKYANRLEVKKLLYSKLSRAAQKHQGKPNYRFLGFLHGAIEAVKTLTEIRS
uniref:Uncharacterized protein n=1 Tax=Downingia cuspidata TaxID=101772 RepID=A0A1Z2QT69_9ASTR|nr:hypothetical protein Do_cus1Pt0112 [Downingia cuspidata]ASA34587.1 hypothetical protein Do_cus1Pt0112 [Downingia cuspidata]